jgi:rhodanese-related sulfurtransferase
MRTISREELSRRLARERPSNDETAKGFALISILEPDIYERAHIPESLNIAPGEEGNIEKRFAKEKELILYCGSPDCPASTRAAHELERRGFTRVIEYEGGISDWQIAGNWLARGGGPEKKAGNM